MKQFRLLIFLVLFVISCASFAHPYYGAQYSNIVYASEPTSLSGSQLMLNYDPQTIQWRTFNIYFDGGYSHFWMMHRTQHNNLNIYAAAPVIRYQFIKRGYITPYLELSIGIAYLNQTRLDDRNLGMHFAFQDRLGIGFFVGTKEQWSIGVHAVHYSNAHLCERNAGISIPFDLDMGYRFTV